MYKRGALLTAVFCGISWSYTLPAAFQPNRGQAAAGIDYLTWGGGYSVALRAQGADLRATSTKTRRAPRLHVSMVLAGARCNAPGRPEAQLPGVVNYINGRDASRNFVNIPTYERVRYRGIYPGIDILYYGNLGHLEYDFIVAPGADPRRIRLRFDGARDLRLDPHGDLLLETTAGTVRQHRPVIYQEAEGIRRPIDGHYVLRGRFVTFALASYDRTRPLVIDPALSWATYSGVSSGATKTGEALALDSSGNIYIIGSALMSGGNTDVFFEKLNPAGTSAIYSTVINDQGDDYGYGIAVDSAGDVYLTGETDSQFFPATPVNSGGGGYYGYYGYYGGYGTLPGTNGDAFVTKVAPSGQQQVYSYFLGGDGQDVGYGITLDSLNDAYVVGATNSLDGSFPATNSYITGTGAFTSGTKIFVSLFDRTGNFRYAVLLGGSGNDEGYGITVDSSSNLYITGQTTSQDFPTTNSAFQSKYAGGQGDAFVMKLSTVGGPLYSSLLGGSGMDAGYAIALDSKGAIYVTGETASKDFPLMNPLQQAFGGGNGDIFVTKMASTGQTLSYSTYLGGSGEDVAYGLAVDSAGDAYITGATSSTNFPVSDPFQAKNQNSTSAVVAGLNPSGSALLFSSYLGGNGSAGTGGDYGRAVAVSCTAGLVVVGTTASTNFPVTSGALATQFGGGTSDAFVAKIASGGMPAIASGGVVNTASMAVGPVAPGSIISIYGSNLALATQAATTTPLSTSLGGASVSVNGTPAPISYASAGRIDVQVPYEATGNTASITVTAPCGTSAAASVPLAQVAPYVLQNAAGDAEVYNQDGTVNSASNPAKTGSVIIIFLTGIGPLDNPVATGAAAPATPLSRATQPASVTIGGWDTPIQFLGLIPGSVGWAQANLVVPQLSAGAYPVVVTVGGVASNGPNVYIH